MYIIIALLPYACVTIASAPFVLKLTTRSLYEVFKSVSLPAGFSHIKQALLQNLAALTRDLAAALRSAHYHYF